MKNRKFVLYVEDELELCLMVKEELEEHGVNVLFSDCYNDAFHKVSNQKFDLIIVDIHLKKGTGDQVIEMIKTNPAHVNFETPVMVASAKITHGVVKRVGQFIDHAFVKPFNVGELVEKAHEFLKTNSLSEKEKTR